MKTLFLGFNLLAATFVQFNTQDQIYREAFKCDWIPQIGWGDENSNSEYGVLRIDHFGQSALTVKSTKDAKFIRLNNYPYPHKVKKTAQGEWLITSDYFEQYWKSTDKIEVVFFH